ncbi:hypothetical protein ABTF76_20620, partial [Acinetobacter baumannii]
MQPAKVRATEPQSPARASIEVIFMMVSLRGTTGQSRNGASPVATKCQVLSSGAAETADGVDCAGAAGVVGSAGGVASLDGAT